MRKEQRDGFHFQSFAQKQAASASKQDHQFKYKSLLLWFYSAKVLHYQYCGLKM